MPVESVSRPSWRYMWFGVRVLIILVLVLGFWLVWIMHLARIQREAVAGIQNDGGTVLYDWEWDNGHSVPAGQPRAPRWLVARIGVDFFGHVTVLKSRSLAQVGRLTRLQRLHVHLLDDNTLSVFRLNPGVSFRARPQFGVQDGDFVLGPLKGLTKLSELDLRGMPVSDAGLVHLEGLTNLTTLHLNYMAVSDHGLTHLKGLTNLSTLDLSNTQVSDAGLGYLARLSNLSTLDLSNTQVRGAGLAYLEGLANLSTLDLSNTQVSDAELAYLERLANLSTLRLNGTQVSDRGLVHLKGLTRLSSIELRGTRVSDAGANELRQALPGLKLVLL